VHGREETLLSALYEGVTGETEGFSDLVGTLGDEAELLETPDGVVGENLAELGRSEAGQDVVGCLGLYVRADPERVSSAFPARVKEEENMGNEKGGGKRRGGREGTNLSEITLERVPPVDHVVSLGHVLVDEDLEPRRLEGVSGLLGSSHLGDTVSNL
jgi:hypothetical protein